MQVRQLNIPGSFEFTPRTFPDSRGTFTEWYRFEALEEAVGAPLQLKQANVTRSRLGVVRGIHYVDLPGQGKYVTCSYGAVMDYIIDIRVGSPTYGQWQAIRLDDQDRRAVYVAHGLGHAYVALEDNSIVTYLCSNVYNADTEGVINPADTDIALEYPDELTEPILSERDLAAPGFKELESAGKLPTWEESKKFFDLGKWDLEG